MTVCLNGLVTLESQQTGAQLTGRFEPDRDLTAFDNANNAGNTPTERSQSTQHSACFAVAPASSPPDGCWSISGAPHASDPMAAREIQSRSGAVMDRVEALTRIVWECSLLTCDQLDAVMEGRGYFQSA